MTREQAKYNLKAIEHFANGGSLVSYNNIHRHWYIENNPTFTYTDKFHYIINDEFVEYRKAIALGKSIEFRNNEEEDSKWESITSNLVPNREFFNRLEYRIKPETEFPIYAKANNSNLYVEFNDETTGKVIYANNCAHVSGQVVKNWVPVFDKKYWVIIDNPYELTDKCLVECWDDNHLYSLITFYDAVYKCTFDDDGRRNGVTYEHYKRIPPWQESEWVAETRRKLED